MKKIFILSFSIMYLNAIEASLQVLPTRVILTDNNRNSSLTIKNKSSETKEYLAKLVYYSVSKKGKYEILEQTEESKDSAINYIKFSPKKIILKPGEEQTIRVQRSIQANNQKKDFRCHIHFSPKNELNKSNKIENDKKNLAFNLTPAISVAVPIIAIFGMPERKVDIRDIQFNENGGLSFVEFDIVNNNKETFVFGDLKAELLDINGVTSQLFEINGINSYVLNSHYTKKVQIKKDYLKNKTLKITFKSPEIYGNQIVISSEKLFE